MKTVKDDKLSTLQNVYLFQKQYHFALTMLSGFTLDETPELIDDSDLWDKIQDALGKKGVFDLAMPKPRGEVVVVGKCFTTGGKPVDHKEVSFRAGNVRKRAVVFGNRTWKKSTGKARMISDPEPFTEMDISWSNAFGGSKYKKNPDGTGIEDIELPSGDKIRPLPNVEDPKNPIVALSDKPDPAGFAPLGLDWPERVKKLGTFDKKWLNEGWPGYPDDYNFGYFNVAPEDQRIEDFWTGNEKVEIKNMNPERSRIRSQVPGIKPRGFINSITDDGESFEEIPLKMDTVWLLPGQNTGVSIWRGETVVSDDEASQVSHLVAFYEGKDEEPKPLAFYQDKLKEEPEEAELEAVEAEGETAEKARIAVPGMKTAVPLTAAGAAATAAAASAAERGEEPTEVKKEPVEGDKEAEVGEEAGEGEKPAEKEAEAAPGEGPETDGADLPDPELTEEEKTELRKIFDERGWDFDEAMAAREKALKETPTEMQAQKDPFNLAGLDPNIMDLERDEIEKAVAAHFKKQGFDIDKQPSNQELQTLKATQLEGLRDWKKICLETGIDDPEVLAEFDQVEAQLMQGKAPAESEEGEATPEETAEIPAEEEKAPTAKESVQDKLDSGESLEGADLSGAELEGMDLQGCNLSGANLENVNLANVNLAGAVLSGAILTRTMLSGANLKGAKLGECSASNCNLSKADLSGADFSNADLHQADLSEVDMTGANLAGADLSEANMTKALCTGVQAEGVQLIGADLTDTDFKDAILKNAELSGASIDKANFEKADLGNAILYGIVGTTAIFKDADMNQSRSDEKTRITEAEFSGGNLSEVTWNESDFQGTNFSGADFSKGSLLQCNLENTNFNRVVAKETNFSKCNFSQSNLTEINLFKGSLRKAVLTEVDLSRSNLYSVDFYQAILQDTLFEDANLNKTLLSQSEEIEK